MVSKHVCGYEQKITRIYDYGYTYDKRGNLVKEEEICSPTTTGPKNITVATYLYDETNRMVRGTNKTGEVSAYTFNGLGVRVGTELILKDNTHGYTDFHCQTPSVETGIEKPEVVKTDYVIDYTRLNIDQRVLMKSEQDGYDFFYTYGLDKLQVMTIGEGSNWWGQSIKKCVNMAYVHTDRLGSVVNLSDQYGRVTARADYTDWGEVRRYTDITVDGGFRRLLPEITYATHEYDDVLNQFYAKARMYDAENKRFAAVDPILDPARYEIGLYVLNPMMLVQQVYAFDAPYTYIDPLGLMNYFTQTDDLLSGVAQGIKDNTIGLIESIPQTISMVKELAVGAVKGEIDLLTLAKTVLEGAFGDYYHVARYIDTLDPFVSKTDAQVYRYGRAVGSVATDVALALVGATVVDKVADILQSSKAGQKILNLAKKAQGYFEDLTCKNKQQLSTTLYQLTDEAGGIQRSITKGSWQDVNESMSKASRDYQAAITGHTGQAWVQNGVKFDGYSNGILIETKAKYSQFVDSSGTFRSWFKGADGFVDQARRQLAAANGAPITWYFKEKAARDATEILFRQNGITGIKLVYSPGN